jgi:hypothetical protein
MRDLEGQLVDERLRRLYSYWRAACRGRWSPARRDLDPVEFHYLLGHVGLIDVSRDPLRFRWRLHGTSISARLHRDLTGQWIDEMPETDLKAYLLDRCRGLVETGMPLRVAHERTFEERAHSYEALWLPLSDDETVTMLMLAMIYPREQSFGLHPFYHATMSA